MKEMRVRIEGDSRSPRSWKVTNAETGESIPVTELTIHVTPDNVEVTLKVLAARVDVRADVKLEDRP